MTLCIESCRRRISLGCSDEVGDGGSGSSLESGDEGRDEGANAKARAIPSDSVVECEASEKSGLECSAIVVIVSTYV